MKKIALFSVLFTLAAALFFVACQKENPTSLAESASYANPANPFDYVGAKHNECLNLLEQNGTVTGLNLAAGAKILSGNGQGSVYYQPYLYEFALAVSSKDPIKDLTTKWLAEGSISESLYAAMGKLNQLVKSYGFSPQLSQAIISFESTFSSLSLSDRELQTLYAAASVARFSNAHWSAKNANLPTDRTLKDVACIGADMIVSTLGGTNPALGAMASIKVWELWGRLAPGDGGRYGLPWGGGIYGPPCDPSYACPCTIEPGGGSLGPFYMSGIGAAIDAEVVFLAMDGSKLDPGFAERFNTGVYHQEFDCNIPEQVVRELYEAGGLALPSGPTVFPAGPKDVLVLDNAWYLTFPVVYDDGTATNWYVMITSAE